MDRMNEPGLFCHVEVVPDHSFLATSLVFALISEVNDDEFKAMAAGREKAHNILCPCVRSVANNACLPKPSAYDS